MGRCVQDDGLHEHIDSDDVAADTRSQPDAPVHVDLLPAVSLPLLGLGLLRGWLSVLFENGLTAAGGYLISQNTFDLVLVIAYLLCALFAKRLTPLYPQRWARVVGGLLLVSASLLGGAFTMIAAPFPPLIVIYVLCAGTGTVLVTLLWLELYGMLNPIRACLYYAASIAVGYGVGWLYQGFLPAWLPVAAALLPLASLRCLTNAYAGERIPITNSLGWADFAFPWKPVLVVAMYSLAYGMLQSAVSPIARQVTSAGTALCAIAIVAAILFIRDRLDFGVFYGVMLPAGAAVSLVLAASGTLGPWWTNFLANWGHVTSQVFIITMMSSICYHWGVSAVWLFGIEDIVWILAALGGRLIERIGTSVGLTPFMPIVIIVIIATVIILQQGRLSSSWGMLLGEGREKDRPVSERISLTSACATIALAHNLSQREEEVLLLLARHMTARDIQRELCVANGTAKAHVRHVYQKLGIHTRDELFAMVDEARRG